MLPIPSVLHTLRMLRLNFVLVLLLLSCYFQDATALNIKQKKSSTILTGMHLLPRSVQLSNTSFCFFGAMTEESLKKNEASSFCSFDSGANVQHVETAHIICTSGVVVDQRVYCPYEELPHDEDGEVEYSSLIYTEQEGGLREEQSEKNFIFKSSKQSGEVKQILFNGNAVRLDDDEEGYVLVSTIVNDAEEKKVIVFKSEDGFIFRAIAVVSGAEDAERHYLLSEGGRRLTLVSAYENVSYTSASSGYTGSFWSAPKPIKAAAPPTSAAFSSGALVQYACSNETSKTAKWYFVEEAAKRPLTPKLFSVPDRKEANGGPVLFFAVAGEDNTGELVVLHDELLPKGTSGLRLSAYRVDDSEEAKEKADKIAKKREEVMKREAARFKAKLERLEKEKTLRREQRRKELERKRKFLTEDEPNVHKAKSFMKEDGEMILIRRVHKESIALEKEVFFSDL